MPNGFLPKIVSSEYNYEYNISNPQQRFYTNHHIVIIWWSQQVGYENRNAYSGKIGFHVKCEKTHLMAVCIWFHSKAKYVHLNLSEKIYMKKNHVKLTWNNSRKKVLFIWNKYICLAQMKTLEEKLQITLKKIFCVSLMISNSSISCLGMDKKYSYEFRKQMNAAYPSSRSF